MGSDFRYIPEIDTWVSINYTSGNGNIRYIEGQPNGTWTQNPNNLTYCTNWNYGIINGELYMVAYGSGGAMYWVAESYQLPTISVANAYTYIKGREVA